MPKKTKDMDQRKLVSWSSDMHGHAEKCVGRGCELAHKSVGHLSRVSTPCLYDHQFTKDDFDIVGKVADVCPQIVLKCILNARNGRPDSYGQSTHWIELSHNGTERATEGQRI